METKIAKKVLQKELCSPFSQNILVEYISLLTNVLINFGYPTTDLYIFKKKLFSIINHPISFPLNLKILEYILNLFFDLLLNK